MQKYSENPSVSPEWEDFFQDLCAHPSSTAVQKHTFFQYKTLYVSY